MSELTPSHELMREREAIVARIGEIATRLTEVNQEYNQAIIDLIELNGRIRENDKATNRE